MPIKCPIKRKEYNQKNKEAVAASHKKYQLKNKDRIAEYQKEYRLKNKKPPKPAPTQEELESKIASQKKYQREYHKNRRETDPLFNLSQCLRSRIGYAFKVEGHIKSEKTEQLLGATFGIVKTHLENLFKEGMSWDNHGEWEIDHIKPFASAKTEEKLKALCHYTNLQPLWKKDNREKGKKV